jgi:hypothetical protein
VKLSHQESIAIKDSGNTDNTHILLAVCQEGDTPNRKIRRYSPKCVAMLVILDPKWLRMKSVCIPGPENGTGAYCARNRWRGNAPERKLNVLEIYFVCLKRSAANLGKILISPRCIHMKFLAWPPLSSWRGPSAGISQGPAEIRGAATQANRDHPSQNAQN